MTKLLATGETDLLEGFVSNKTRRKFKARLAWDAKEGKVVFAFEPRPERRPAAKKGGAAATAGKTPAKKTVAKRAVAKKAPPRANGLKEHAWTGAAARDPSPMAQARAREHTSATDRSSPP